MRIQIEKVEGGYIIKAFGDEPAPKATIVAATPAKAASAVKTLLESPPA